MPYFSEYNTHNKNNLQVNCDYYGSILLVEAAAGAVFGVVVAFDLAFAHLFGVAAGFIVASFLFGCGQHLTTRRLGGNRRPVDRLEGFDV